MLTIVSQCWLCQQPLYHNRHGICCYCQRHLPVLPPCCPCCGLPSTSTFLRCGRCLIAPPRWHHMMFVGDYAPPLSGLIKQLKFGGAPQLAPVLARLLLLRWLRHWRETQCRNSDKVIKPQRIVSVPLHHWRCWRRGYNQTDLLARPLAHWLGCDYTPLTLQRIHATPPQQRLTAVQRRKNVRGIFRCAESVRGQHIALLDDVVTTGSTLNEIAHLLWAQGIASLQIWCVCRTL
ncbi:DNA utilization protein GntX [Yersinia pseudotuberculosis]|uniref:DNA utilization protein GntX n=1 Tax=Yersinia pseudotuberculosis TaxID=633 RepID=A0A0T9JJ65_YERPU|nr:MULTISPECIES: DNA utilization protein GntX [Yersinia pseudotuberculosis complex]PSH11294.1 DNA utilization protein GntX [Yersinia pseudotuberculosis]CNC75262.1 DNA utilization protein GntX [Yersinia pseudotuberculosis]CRY73889.1 DNA utilization protein GntX [Yersinia pseudotuberculosis]SUP80138.1 DNA utilization protein GntX [Yersinia pseudotuberculosis]